MQENKTTPKKVEQQKDNQLFSRISELIEQARGRVASVVNLTMVHTYFEVGRMIIDNEQQGKERAEYGKSVLKELSARLTAKFGKGFSEQNLRNMRQFFTVYSDRGISIRQTPSSELKNTNDQFYSTASQNPVKTSTFTLSWSHYLVLMRIENPSERRFYEIEALNNNWSEAQLKRQYHSSLYERLALSRNKEDVLKLANEGQTIFKPTDILKNPLSIWFSIIVCCNVLSARQKK